MNGYGLFLATVAIWGSTWIPVGIQAATVPPDVSIAYRFMLAGALLAGWTALGGGRLRFGLRDHAWLAAQGLLLFCLNYIPIYWASRAMTTGLVALTFSTVVVFTILINAAVERRRPDRRAGAAAACALAGLAAVFGPEIAAAGSGLAVPVLLCLIGALCAAAGTVVAARNTRAGIPVASGAGIAMLYGGGATALHVTLSGTGWAWDSSWGYAGSLAYLVVAGSIVGFRCYLAVVRDLGPERASFIPVLFPLVALALSTLIEGYQWTPSALAGAAVVVLGNAVALRRPRPKGPAAAPAFGRPAMKG